MNIEKQEIILSEKNKDLNKSIELYEKILKNSESCSVDYFINLIFIYFLINDPGEMDFYKISIKFVDECNEKMIPLINEAKEQYPKNVEVLFWENYINFILWGEIPFDKIDSKFVMQRETLIPFFYFYDPLSEEFREEAALLYSLVREGSSFKDRYVKGILDRYFK